MYSKTICKLPSEVQSALRSGVVITSMAQCVDELVSPAMNCNFLLQNMQNKYLLSCTVALFRECLFMVVTYQY